MFRSKSISQVSMGLGVLAAVGGAGLFKATSQRTI